MKITLKQRKLRTGKKSLYIEFYKGSITDKNGKRKHIRERENLKLYLHADPKTTKEKNENREVLKLAENICAIRKAEHAQGKYGIKNDIKSKRLFLEYYNEVAEEKGQSTSLKNYGVWSSSFGHIKNCVPPHFTFEEVNQDFVKRVRSYFDKEAKTKSNTLLSQNTKYSYFNKFKACLRKAFEEGYTQENFARYGKSFEQAESQREYLTIDELQDLSKAYCKYDVLKRAFIFSCLTGVRWSDIDSMKWSEVRDEGEDYKINFRQKKTGRVEYLYISKQARELMLERKSPSDKVFTGLKYGMVYNLEILRWCNRAGITKHITFHSARHTNAILLLENGADIYTVSKRLGHRELRTTEIYAKVIDIKMREAANLIPELIINL